MKKYIGKNYAVHCPTQEIFDQIVKLRTAEGISPLASDRWKNYKQETCLSLQSGRFAPISYYKINDWTILDSSQFITQGYEIY